ncbi:glycoside hydrolase family 2 TIM barrel-domain containing protein [uncultured Draconibacterium sp.]|uniref:glycoside hydrolase family 2 protein n=1 Tax=uncultured Draconibacterium sp. TaxID=1573823 RepID=UPI0032608D86
MSLVINLMAQDVPKYSIGGYYPLENSGREYYNFNVGWLFVKSDVPEAHQRNFDDSTWDVVSCPHGLELLPAEASGCINYQGPAWYRKHFTPDENLKGRQTMLYFEAVMGKSKVWVNGKLVKEHFGGYLPIAIDLTNELEFGRDNVIAVWADNSDDANYPPGKPQNVLDFTYFGGIYRDVWLIAQNNVFITNQNFVDKVAGGGVSVHFEDLNEENVTVCIDVDLQNDLKTHQKIKVLAELSEPRGAAVANSKSMVKISKESLAQKSYKLKVSNPKLWTPDNPFLYNLDVKLTNEKGKILDGVRLKVGLRSIEFRGEHGFYLNGKPFDGKLLGVNRHQDYAYVGNALPNSGQWRDAKKFKDTGMNIVRAAHYPMDAAFMDACDALGLFVIVATPGWQFWNTENPDFEQRVYSDIRRMVRRDRNRPSVIMWEPILNETNYPERFGITAHKITHEEYPWPGCQTASDAREIAKGYEVYDVYYFALKGSGKSSFRREFGDNVDDFFAHNSNSRCAIEWGEYPQLKQSLHYAEWLDGFIRREPWHTGGALWAGIDHQRGYHADPFYGGIFDVFRRPKMSYYLLSTLRNPNIIRNDVESGPMVHIANELTPFSGKDIVVFTNCEQVRLSMYGGEPIIQDAPGKESLMPVVFENAFDFMAFKQLNRQMEKIDGYDRLNVKVEGLIDGKVVAVHNRLASRQTTKIQLRVDDEGIPLAADGSDFVPVIAEIVDSRGVVKRLNQSDIKFEVSGEGRIIGDASIGANPRRIQWGSAPVLIQSTTTPGKINVSAQMVYEGKLRPLGGELEIVSQNSPMKLLYSQEPCQTRVKTDRVQEVDAEEVEKLKKQLQQAHFELNQLKLKEVGKEQHASPADEGKADPESKNK